MSDLAKHLINSIYRDAESLNIHGGLTKNNLLLIEAILRNPSRDYEPGDPNIKDAPPAYILSKQGSDVSMTDRPYLPPRNVNEAPKPSLPSRPRSTVDSPPVPSRPKPFSDQSQQFKEPAKPLKVAPPPPISSKPIGNDKLASQYRNEQEKKQEAKEAKKNELASKVGNQVAMSGASGLGFGVGMGVARHLI